MRKIDWTPIIWITVILILIVLVYFIFEKRIEAIPDKINLEKPTVNDSLFSAGKL